MRHFALLADGIDVAPALAEIDAHPAFWGADPERTAAPGSPHAQSLDVWLRFRPRAELTAPEEFGRPHFAAFYPAWHALPALHPIVFDLMRRVGAVYLGGVMLTRLPAGARILPHVDNGWHAAFLDTKCYVILRANRGCMNFCGDEAVVMHAGSAWQFRNDVTHWVENNGETERIALIVTMKTEN